MGREINVGMNVKENAEAKENVKVKESEKTNIKINTTVNLAGVELRNPVMTASGTFGSGQEYGELIDLNRLAIKQAVRHQPCTQITCHTKLRLITPSFTSKCKK